MSNLFLDSIPLDAKTFIGTIAGDRSPITENSLTPEQQQTLYKLVQMHQKYRLKTLESAYENYPEKFAQSTDKDFNQKNLMAARSGQGYLTYDDFNYGHLLDPSLNKDTLQQLKMTLGRATYQITPKSIQINDNYDFDNRDRSDKLNTYSNMNPIQKTGKAIEDSITDTSDYLQNGLPINTPINELGRMVGGEVGMAILGRQGRPVTISLKHDLSKSNNLNTNSFNIPNFVGAP